MSVDKKVTELTEMTAAHPDDVLHIVDVSESISKKIKVSNVGASSVNVVAYGADSTGVTDSTAAIQDAVNNEGNLYVPNGKFRIDGSIDINEETTIVFERGHQPQRNWFISPGSWPFDNTVGRECLLFKDESSSNVPFFKIRHRDVNLLGFPRMDVSDRNTFNAGIVEYALGDNNPIQNNGRAACWGGIIEIIVTGNNDTLDDVGNGAKCIHVTWDNQANYSELTQQRWFVFGMNVAYGAYMEAQDEAMTTYSNNIHGHFDLVRAKQVVFNDCSTGCLWTGGLQNFGCMQLSEAPKAAIHLTENAASNVVDFEIFDITTTPFATDGAGQYGVSALIQNEARNTKVIRENAGSIADTRVAGRLPTGPSEMFYAPIGVVPYSNRDNGSGLNGMLFTALNNNFANMVMRSTLVYDVYDGTAVADSDTAVTDAVFANASGSSVDITSALGGIPTLSVGAVFTISNHSDRENNGDYEVTASIANGYTCTKLGPDLPTASNATYFREDPSNAVAEAITVTTGIGAKINDSVTESIATSAEWTETRTFTEITKTYGAAPAITFTQNAVDDEDYLELHFSHNSNHDATTMWLAVNGDGGFKKVQLIRKLSGAVVDNYITTGTRSADQDQLGLDRLFISGGACDETIIRCIGPRTTKTLIFEDIATVDNDRSAEGHFLSQQGGQTVEGNITFRDGDWDGAHIVLGSNHLWLDSTGDLRIKSSAPTGDTDGTVVGTQS